MKYLHQLLSKRLKSFLSGRSYSTDPDARTCNYSISIVIPSYNQKLYLERTLNSILNQRFSALEIIVIDGGSDDGTVELLQKYDDVIDYWVSEPDNGQADALNKGLEKATGDIIGWQNSDDIYFPEAFWLIDAAFTANPEVALVSGTVVSINEHDDVKRLSKFERATYRNLLVQGFILSSQGTFWRRSVHDEIGTFNTDLGHAMDYDFWLRLLRNYEAAFVPQVLGGFRVYPGTKTSEMGYKGTIELNNIRYQHGFDAKTLSSKVQHRFLRMKRLSRWSTFYLPAIISQAIRPV